MSRLVRDFFEVEDQVSLDRMIDLLANIRDQLPEGSEDAKVQMRGDDVFGRRLTVSFLRPQTLEEAALDARYDESRRRLSIAA
jgi:hypothetical protein